MEATEAPSAVSGLEIRACDSHGDMKLCVDLHGASWFFRMKTVVPAAIFVIALNTGGHVYCAFGQEQALGFAPAFSSSRRAPVLALAYGGSSPDYHAVNKHTLE
jgi:hypothetical protein